MSDFPPYGGPPPPERYPPQPPHAGPPRSPEDSGLNVLLGLVLAVCLVAVQIPLWIVAPVTIAMGGLVQVVYIVPLSLLFHRLRRPNLTKGLIIGASVIFLLNATCLGLGLLSQGLGKI